MVRRWQLIRLYWQHRHQILRAAAAAGPGRQVAGAYQEMARIVAHRR